MPLLLFGLGALAAGAGAWWANDALERKGVKAPGQLEPGIAWQAAAIGALLGAGAVLWLRSRR